MKGNLFQPVLDTGQNGEIFDTLCSREGVRIERIVSTGQSSAPGFWYDQPGEEWVALLSGEATLRFEDEATPMRLTPGDWVLIAAHRRHRVDATSAQPPAVWLAVHLDPP